MRLRLLCMVAVSAALPHRLHTSKRDSLALILEDVNQLEGLLHMERGACWGNKFKKYESTDDWPTGFNWIKDTSKVVAVNVAGAATGIWDEVSDGFKTLFADVKDNNGVNVGMEVFELFISAVPAANVVATLTAVTAKLVSGELSKEDFEEAAVEAAVGVSKDAAKAAFELFLPGATAITGLTEDIINKVKEGANC